MASDEINNEIKQEFLPDNHQLVLVKPVEIPPIKFEHITIEQEDDATGSSGSYDPLGLLPDKNHILELQGEVIDHIDIKKELNSDVINTDIDCDEEDNIPLKKLKRKGKYRCSICNKKYKNLLSFQKHETSHQHVLSSKSDNLVSCLTPKNGVYTCRCGKGFHIRKNVISCLQSHRSPSDNLNLDVESLLSLCGRQRKKNFFCCRKCDFTCKKQNIFRQHKLSHKQEDCIYKCDQCDYSGKRLSTLNRHKLVHTDVKPLTCTHCSYRCKLKTKMKKHELIHTASGRKCEECDFSCRLNSTMKKHRKQCHGHETVYSCEQCDYTGTRSSTYQRHLLVHQKDKPFACDLCKYRCKLSNKLKVHRLTHLTEKVESYNCDECPYTTWRMGFLKVHKRSHINDKIYRCDECEYCSPVPEHLEAHKKIHLGKRAYPCMQCSYVSIHSGSFRRHLLTHSGEKPFACDMCDYKTTQANILKSHKYTHTGDRPYKCEECDYATSIPASLKRHKLVHEPIVW